MLDTYNHTRARLERLVCCPREKPRQSRAGHQDAPARQGELQSPWALVLAWEESDLPSCFPRQRWGRRTHLREHQGVRRRQREGRTRFPQHCWGNTRLL